MKKIQFDVFRMKKQGYFSKINYNRVHYYLIKVVSAMFEQLVVNFLMNQLIC